MQRRRRPTCTAMCPLKWKICEGYGRVRAASCRISYVYVRLYEKYRESGLKVRVWTVNREEDLERFIREDLEAVITNYPDVALRVRKRVENA